VGAAVVLGLAALAAWRRREAYAQWKGMK
jgi:MYXO-CTERM domain-containing protein